MPSKINDGKASKLIQSGLHLLMAVPFLSLVLLFITEDTNQRLKLLLSHAIRILSTKKEKIVALDACGGTGQASFLLYDLGCTTNIVDLSSNMIENMEKSCIQKNIEVETFNSEINEFFKKNTIFTY